MSSIVLLPQELVPQIFTSMVWDYSAYARVIQEDSRLVSPRSSVNLLSGPWDIVRLILDCRPNVTSYILTNTNRSLRKYEDKEYTSVPCN